MCSVLCALCFIDGLFGQCRASPQERVQYQVSVPVLHRLQEVLKELMMQGDFSHIQELLTKPIHTKVQSAAVKVNCYLSDGCKDKWDFIMRAHLLPWQHGFTRAVHRSCFHVTPLTAVIDMYVGLSLCRTVLAG